MASFKEYIQEQERLANMEQEDLLTEKEKVVRVRDGKKETVYVAKDGYRMQGNKEVKMSTNEIIARKLGQKIGQRKRNVKMGLIQKKIKKSKKKAETLGLDTGRPEE